jgi:hypothetical protein
MADTTTLPPELANLPAELSTLADAVKAANNAIQALSDLLPDETRSLIVEIVNLTSRSLTKGQDGFDHGAFGPTLPAALIPAYQSDLFSVVSSGVATGVEGTVTYTAEGAADFTVHFDNPFLGSNSQSVSSNTDDVLSILGDISSGNHAHARYSVLDRSSPFPSLQQDWASCPKCQGMHFAGFPGEGVCPAGGSHEHNGSFHYAMLFDSRPSTHVQEDWASCPKCQGLHFAGFASKGACPAGGSHDEDGSFHYAMVFDLPVSDGQQDQWRSCSKCNGLFFAPNLGLCPAGGQHEPTNSFNYIMRFTP